MNAKQRLRDVLHGRGREVPSFDGATEWLNSEPLTSDGLRGNVVLVQFWTYSCINWLRTLPYVRAWAEKYADHGLVTIGVHSPEFAFEKNVDDVRRAAQDMHVDYPIAIDSDFAVWQAFHNQYWPALYFVDAQGQIRHEYFGEGEYDQSERMLQKLLGEAGATAIDPELVSVDASGAKWPPTGAAWSRRRAISASSAGRGFASPGDTAFDESRVYAAPEQLDVNRWALSGDWTIAQQFIRLNEAGGRLQFRFHARDLHLVMGPADARATRAISRADRRATAGCRARRRRRRGRQRHRARAAAASTRASVRPDRRPHFRDRVR